ncbi:hypothetical protein D918_08400 [Trichuris suis]|nr:hypothetical protein D918_08400 [Trichuris suis]
MKIVAFKALFNVNRTSLIGLRHVEALDCLLNSGEVLQLTLARYHPESKTYKHLVEMGMNRFVVHKSTVFKIIYAQLLKRLAAVANSFLVELASKLISTINFKAMVNGQISQASKLANFQAKPYKNGKQYVDRNTKYWKRMVERSLLLQQKAGRSD